MARITSRKVDAMTARATVHVSDGTIPDKFGFVMSGETLIINVHGEHRTYTLFLSETETKRLRERL